MMPPSLLDAFAAARAVYTPISVAWHNSWLTASDYVKLMRMSNVYGANQSRQSMTWTAGHLLHGSGFTVQVLARQRPREWVRTTTLRLIESYYPSLMQDLYITAVGTGRPTTKHERTNSDDCQSTLVQHTARPASLQAIDLSILRQRFRP